MAHKMEMDNGKAKGVNKCKQCGAPVHPSLDCKRCDA